MDSEGLRALSPQQLMDEHAARRAQIRAIRDEMGELHHEITRRELIAEDAKRNPNVTLDVAVNLGK